jgi:predicted MFS family arabinose efflux permease
MLLIEEGAMTGGRRLLLAAVCGVAVASVYAAQPVLGEIGNDLGVPPGLTGWIVATGQIGYLVGLVLLVPLGDMVDRRRLIAAHLVVTALGLVLTTVASTAWMALAGLAAAGLFAVVVQTTVAYTAAMSLPEERGRAIGAVTSGVVVGILGARVLAGALAQAWTWRAVYAVLAALLLVLAVLVHSVLPSDERLDRPTRYREALARLGGLFAQRVFLTRGLLAFFLFASFGTLWTGVALPLSAAPWHLGEAAIGMLGFVGLAGALGAARAGRWADSGRTAPVIGISFALLVVSWAAIAQLSWTLWLPILGIVVLDFAVQAVHVSNQHVLASTFPDLVSSVIGSYMVLYSLGSALGAAATTALYATYGWAGSSALGVAFGACGLAVFAVDRWVSPRGPANRESPAHGAGAAPCGAAGR